MKRKFIPFLAVVLWLASLTGLFAQTDYAKAGVLKTADRSEIGLTFSPEVDTNSVPFESNFILTGSTVEGFRFVPENGAVVLATSNLQPGGNYTVRVQGLKSTNGTDLPAINLGVTPREVGWGVIGANELGLSSDAVAVGNNGFDLVSGGFQFDQRYDESTFVFERISGDFDKQVRVDSQWPSSAWARAGLMVRESLDFGKARPSDPFDAQQAFGRYLQVQVNPAATVNGEAGNNKYQVMWRPLPPGSVDGTPPTLLCEYDIAPAYTNAWLRLKREGGKFFAFSSSNGTDWTPLTNCFDSQNFFTFPATDAEGTPLPAFPAIVYLGVNYSPENGNILQQDLRGSFLARFRDYSGSGGQPVPDIILTITKVGTEVEIGWNGTGTLQAREAVDSGTWENVTTTSPFRITPQATRFYRVQQ